MKCLTLIHCHHLILVHLPSYQNNIIEIRKKKDSKGNNNKKHTQISNKLDPKIMTLQHTIYQIIKVKNLETLAQFNIQKELPLSQNPMDHMKTMNYTHLNMCKLQNQTPRNADSKDKFMRKDHTNYNNPKEAKKITLKITYSNDYY